MLVVEDETLLADTLCDLLLGAGCEPVGPAENVAIALGLIETSRIDAAILDVRLMDEMSYAVAYALRARGIPLMFLTASERGQLPVDLSDEILIEKPFKAPMLIETVRRMARAVVTVGLPFGSPGTEAWPVSARPAAAGARGMQSDPTMNRASGTGDGTDTSTLRDANENAG